MALQEKASIHTNVIIKAGNTETFFHFFLFPPWLSFISLFSENDNYSQFTRKKIISSTYYLISILLCNISVIDYHSHSILKIISHPIPYTKA